MTTSDHGTYIMAEPGRFGITAYLIGGAGLALSAIGFFTEPEQFYHSYLTAFTFWISIGLGGLFFTLLHHLVGATWSVVLRRISETLMITLPLMALFFIPLIFGMHDLYHWTHADAVAQDAILQKKAGYLNVPFFLIRTVIYFAVWTLFGFMLYRWSRKQDQGDMSKNRTMRQLSAPGMILFALTVTYAAFDWLMSLDPHWYSTIFGVYYFAGSFLGTITFIVIFCLYLKRRGILHQTITTEHYHDLGKLMFGFTIFWAYIGFSQFFLIWYANIPEETIYYLHRWEGSWQYISLALIFGNLALPFFILMLRSSKRTLAVLFSIAVLQFVMHWVDLYWMILPNYSHHGAHFSWIDLTTTVGIGGVFLGFFWQKFSRNPLVPINDPLLESSIQIKN